MKQNICKGLAFNLSLKHSPFLSEGKRLFRVRARRTPDHFSSHNDRDPDLLTSTRSTQAGPGLFKKVLHLSKPRLRLNRREELAEHADKRGWSQARQVYGRQYVALRKRLAALEVKGSIESPSAVKLSLTPANTTAQSLSPVLSIKLRLKKLKELAVNA